MFQRILIAILLTLFTGYTAQGQPLHTVLAGSTGVKYGTDLTAGSVYEWFVDGGVIGANLNHEVEIDWGFVPGIYEIKVLETNQWGCVGDTVRALVEVTNEFDLDLGGPVIEICEGEIHTLDAGSGFVSYLWNDNPAQIGQTFATGTAGRYWVMVVDANGLIGRDTVDIVVKPMPFVDLGRDTVLCLDETHMLNAGNFGANYLWSTGATTQTIVVSGQDAPTMISVIVDLDGCIAEDAINIFRCTESKLRIPGIFTPNGDGINDRWYILDAANNELSVNYPEAIVEVYDRWGTMVFRSKPGYPEPWDGRFRSRPMPMESYHYIIMLKDGSEDIIGNVTIVR